MNALLNWLDDRTGIKALLHETLYERVPGGARWRYVWGSTLVFAFSVQVITGLFLWMAYAPSATTAWESVQYIQNEMWLGWLLRGIHHFTAQAMVVLLALHLMQVIIDGAYKAPREVNFWLGLILMQIVLGLSLTGYLLPWDQKGYWATKVATNIAGITPGIGSEIQQLAVGGADYGHATLTRFFALHAGLLPGLLIAFLVAHVYVFRRHGITAPNPIYKPDTTFWPDQVLKDGVACLAVLAAVLFFVLRHGPGPHGGAELGAPADPAEQYSAARPEWYFLFLFQFLKYFPGETEIIGAMVIPGAIMGFLFLMPFIGRWKLGHGFNVALIFALMVGVGVLTALALREDNANADYKLAVKDADTKAERIKELVQIKGIGPEGAVGLLRHDSKTQGPVIFAKVCASCHRYDGHDGKGKIPEGKPTASDLAAFGTRPWIKGMITDPTDEHRLGAMKNNPEIGDRFQKGEMARWVEENVKTKTLKEDEVDSLVEFLVGLSDRPDESAPDAKKAAKGMELFALGKDGLSSSCFDCHAMKMPKEKDPEGLFAEASAQIAEGAPELTAYGSAVWLKEFLKNPGHKRFYGGRNAMPAFANQLSDKELDLLVEWLVRRWPAVEERTAEVPQAK